jgi:hypothetical protein
MGTAMNYQFDQDCEVATIYGAQSSIPRGNWPVIVSDFGAKVLVNHREVDVTPLDWARLQSNGLAKKK